MAWVNQRRKNVQHLVFDDRRKKNQRNAFKNTEVITGREPNERENTEQR